MSVNVYFLTVLIKTFVDFELVSGPAIATPVGSSKDFYQATPKPFARTPHCELLSPNAEYLEHWRIFPGVAGQPKFFQGF